MQFRIPCHNVSVMLFLQPTKIKGIHYYQDKPIPSRSMAVEKTASPAEKDAGKQWITHAGIRSRFPHAAIGFSSGFRGAGKGSQRQRILPLSRPLKRGGRRPDGKSGRKLCVVTVHRQQDEIMAGKAIRTLNERMKTAFSISLKA